MKKGLNRRLHCFDFGPQGYGNPLRTITKVQVRSARDSVYPLPIIVAGGCTSSRRRNPQFPGTHKVLTDRSTFRSSCRNTGFITDLADVPCMLPISTKHLILCLSCRPPDYDRLLR